MKIEKAFPAPDLAATYIQGIEDASIDNSFIVDHVELLTKDRYESWVVVVVTNQKKEDKLFNRKGWKEKQVVGNFLHMRYKTWEDYVRAFIAND